ncbi:MAG: hypothetical protein R3E83_06235 [Burkholderiaceae bacterium]
MGSDDTRIVSIEKLTVPMGGQQIELQQVDFAVGGMSLLRTRIREGRRFTVFDIDPASARQWGEALIRWAATQPGGAALQGVASNPGDGGASSENP